MSDVVRIKTRKVLSSRLLHKKQMVAEVLHTVSGTDIRE
uniref:Transcriptional regulator n=1 Tax=Angiostrongylus cantonensis TaxID=6313 RepID=A0A0K0DB14_ANGCA